MLSIFRRSLATGTVTTRYPQEPEHPPPAFRSQPALLAERCTGSAACAAACPTGAVAVAPTTEGWRWSLDRARCAGCGLCVEACPTAALVHESEFELAARQRGDLTVAAEFVVTRRRGKEREG